MTIYKALVVSFLAFLVLPASAGRYTDALGTCLADNTNGKERKELAKWIFVGMAAHPDIQDVTNIPAKTHDDVDRFMGELVTRLLTQSCVSQAQVAVKNEGGAAFKGAFSFLGQVAMQELMTNQAVSQSLSSWEKYFDKEKFKSLMEAKDTK